MKQNNYTRQSILTFSAFILSFITFAQSQFTAGSFTPYAGDQYTVGTSTPVPPGAAGNSQTWDFSNVQTSGSITYEVLAATELPCHTSYPDAVLAIGTGGGYSMISTSDQEVVSYGSSITPGMPGFVYTNPQKTLGFPLSFGESWSDSYNGTNSDGTMRSGDITFTYDGYGDLITPYGTYYGIMRVHKHVSYTDVTSDGNCSAQIDYYYWYDMATRYPLAAIWSQESGTCNITSGAEFTSDIQASVQNEKPMMEFAVYPNPCGENLIVKYSRNLSNMTMILSDMTGNAIQRHTGNFGGQFSFNTSALSSGVYVLTIMNDNEVLSRERIVCNNK
jgi:Secretion system C-terminal sorting domain